VRVTQKSKAGDTQISTMDFLSPGAYLDPTILFQSITANIICSIIFGEHFSYQDPKFLWLLNILKDSFTIFSNFYSQVSSKIPQFPRNQGRWMWGLVTLHSDFAKGNRK
jgi:hypothetical protein